MKKKPTAKDDIIVIDAEIVPSEPELEPREKARLLTEYNRDKDIIFDRPAAIMRIRDSRSYRAAGFATFDECLSADFGITRQQASKIVIGQKALIGIAHLVGTKSSVQLPRIESHIHALAESADDDQDRLKIWKESQKRAKEAGKSVTAALVKSVGDEIAGPKIPSTNGKPRGGKKADKPQVETKADAAGVEGASDTPDAPADPPVSDFRGEPNYVDPLLESSPGGKSSKLMGQLARALNEIEEMNGPLVRSMDECNRELHMTDFRLLIGHFDRVFTDLKSANEACKKLVSQWAASTAAHAKK